MNKYEMEAVLDMAAFQEEFERLDQFILKLMMAVTKQPVSFDALNRLSAILSELVNMDRDYQDLLAKNGLDPEYFHTLVDRFETTYDRVAEELANDFHGSLENMANEYGIGIGVGIGAMEEYDDNGEEEYTTDEDYDEDDEDTDEAISVFGIGEIIQIRTSNARVSKVTANRDMTADAVINCVDGDFSIKFKLDGRYKNPAQAGEMLKHAIEEDVRYSPFLSRDDVFYLSNIHHARVISISKLRGKRPNEPKN